MRHGSLFSGIGGFDLAAEWMGWENIFQVEIDERCQKLLKQNFPHGERYRNIKEFDGTKYRGAIDILSGGPPCQPASQAGKRKGEKDDRWLWPEAIRVFGEVRPRIGVFENPDDLLTLDNGEPFERICCSLENFGYKVETYGIPAACVGAWHERDRIWIVAYSNSIGWNNVKEKDRKPLYDEIRISEAQEQKRQIQQCGAGKHYKVFASTNTQGFRGPTCGQLKGIPESDETFKRREPSGTHAEIGAYWETEPGVVRMVHGLPDRVDRIKGLGNAIVPQVAYQIFKAIDRAL